MPRRAFGEHSRDILRDVAGYDDGAIDRLVAGGVVHEMESPDVALERPYLHWLRHVQRLVPWGEPTFDPAAEMMRRLAADDPDGACERASRAGYPGEQRAGPELA